MLMCMYLRQVYSLPPSLSYPFKHESICLLNHPPHTVLQLNVVFAKNVLVHSLLSPSLYIFLFPSPPHPPSSLSLAVILLFDFHPVQSGVYLWQSACRQLLTHSRPR